MLISQLEHSVALEFEKTDAARKLRLLLSELLFIMSRVSNYPWQSTPSQYKFVRMNIGVHKIEHFNNRKLNRRLTVPPPPPPPSPLWPSKSPS